MKNRKNIALWALLCAGITGCMPVTEYDKMYLNDPDMQLTDKSVEQFEHGFQTYREGAAGGNGGKTGGGCGCN